MSRSDDEPGARSGATGGASAEPTPQSQALRRQQFLVGVTGGVLAGAAAAASVVQRFPDLPLVVPLAVGLLGGVGIVWLAARSIFPGGGDGS